MILYENNYGLFLWLWWFAILEFIFFMTYELKYMTATKVYNYLGISKALFYRVLKNDPTFPKGLEITKGKKVYDKNSIDKWLLSKNSQTNLS